jgi:cyclic beta-1,2-glucan synthetase
MDAGALVGYFGKKEEVRKALRELRRKGYHRAAYVSKSADGEVHRRDPFLWRRVFRAVAAFIVFGIVASIVSAVLLWPGPIAGSTAGVAILGAGAVGGILCLASFRRSKSGVDSHLIEDHSRWLVPGESVLILQAPIETLEIPVAVLLDSGEVPPALFILRPAGESPGGEGWNSGSPLTPSQLQDHARRLATVHQLALHPSRGAELLKKTERSRRWVQEVCLALTGASRLEQGLPPSAEWLLDNEYILESNARGIRRNLPRRYYRELPVLANEPDRDLPRIYGLARELVEHADLRLDQENILSFIAAYQRVASLSIGELWAVPQMLRLALMGGIQYIAFRALTDLRERGIASFWANRLIAVNRQDPHQIFSILAELARSQPAPSPYFASQLIDYLYDEGPVMEPVQRWLERKFQKSLSDLGLREKNRQTEDQLSIGNAFTSLRQLDLLDWKVCFEKLSRVDELLRMDPAGIYAEMDFDTRDRCRRVIEDLRRNSGLAEERIAQSALDLARRAHRGSATDSRLVHVGAYLIGESRGELARMIGCRESLPFRALQWTYRHHSSVYFAGLGLVFLSLISLVILFGLREEGPGIQLLVALLLLVPSSQISLEVMNYLVMRLLPPRSLPKMDYRVSGIPDDCRTLVVVPMMLVDVTTIDAEAEKLEIRFLANKEANLLFGLFTDYRDAPHIHCDTDESLLQAAKRSMEDLNRRYGGERFFLFHREREWSESEQKFIGWERKRGKLEELNGLIDGTRMPGAECLVHVGNADRLADVRFVITLDSDTQLPHDTARRLIETIAHPLNRLRIDSQGRILSGYTIIQPRVSPSLPSTNGSPFSRLFSDPVGVDPYTTAVSDVNQDLTGEASYHGKGIYDTRAFSRVLSGRFPDALLLSHDLIEGAHVRVGLASDIELYDEFPRDYLTFIRRQHRWIRGDWQIMDWVMPRVPRHDGGRARNPLSWFNRGKIFDNLRRSLLPAGSLVLLVASWLISFEAGMIATMVVSANLLFHSLAQPFTWATTRRGSKGISSMKVAHDLARVIVEAALLPYQAWLAADAIARALYRSHISHRGLLEWASAQVDHDAAGAGVPRLLFSMGLASLFSVIMVLAVRWLAPSNLWPTAPWLLLWFVSPVIGWLLNRRPLPKQPQLLLASKDRQFLRKVARRTWRYFSDFVNEKSSWLPPDNYQVSYQNGLAMRTSPTNIGFWMVSALGAHDLGYITVDEVTRKLTQTMETIARLERHEGHLLNWYDIQTLVPLKPRYVSTADSGNLLGALWTLDRGLGALKQAPIIDREAFAGLRDTGEILRQVVLTENVSGLDMRALDNLLRIWGSPPDRIVDALDVLRGAGHDVRDLAESARVSDTGERKVAYWAGQMQSQLDAWLNIADRYLSWIEILGEKTAEEAGIIDPDLLEAIRGGLHHAPSLQDLAGGDLEWIPGLQKLREKAPPGENAVAVWFNRIFKALDDSKWLAGEMLAAGERLARQVRELSESINMRFLYSSDRRLFSIGYNVSEGRLDHAYYDLLASEARLGSFVAIARGDIPAEHWFAMSRPYGAIGRRQVLLSWTGTMFEYLMPLLFQQSFANTLLEKATGDAVAVQIAYGRKHHVPWGVSESASGDLDVHRTYQYNAFGVPELGLKRGQVERIVIAPYATLLAVALAPRETVHNLKHLARLGMLDDFGYYEAIDFNHQPDREGGRGVIVRTYMAHHQGMGLLALINFLRGNPLKKAFHADPRVRAVEPLLHERIPHLPPLDQVSAYSRVSSVAAIGEDTLSVSEFDTPHTSTPKTQLLSNGRYGLMLTNAGGGYSSWRGIEITRWRADRTEDPWGTFCYIHDADSGRLWCNTYQPAGGEVEGYSANFSLDRAVFRREDSDVESETEIIVAPEDDVEIRRMTLINRSLRTRHLDLTSYIELSMASHNADRQHPAFNKLFIETEAVPGQESLLAHRRSRQESDPPMWVGHRFTLEQNDIGVLHFETDRGRFIGRGRTLAAPMGAVQDPGNSQGFVIDPILSLRQRLTLGSRQRVQVSMVVVAGGTREHVLSLLSKYADPRAIERAMELVWASAQLELRSLRIQPDEARRFQQLASHLLYPNPLLRSPAERIMKNRKGQSGLWAYAISGDLPIALVAVGEERDIGLVRQMLQAHTYWRIHGLATDLVILNEEAGGYRRPLHEALELLVQSHAANSGEDRRGGIYLRDEELIPAEDLTLLRAVASVVVVGARGTLPQQFGLPLEAPDLPEPVASKRDPRDPSAVLPFMDLPYFNSLGGFTPDGREYAIYLGPGIHTPAPWVNIIANPGFGTLVSETGSGFTWQGNSGRNRLTQWSNDPVVDPPSEAIYIRDEETGICWTPCASPIREESAYRARHGAGYSVFEHNSHGIEQELTVFVPVDEKGGEPVKIQRLSLRNDSERPRKLSLTFYAEWTLGEFRESSQMHVVTRWDDDVHALLASNYFNPDYADHVAFAAASEPAESYTGDRTAFLGRNRSMRNPAAMDRTRLSCRTGAGLDPCAAIQSIVNLAPGERIEISFMLGQVRSLEDAHTLVRVYRERPAVEAALERTKAWWDNCLGSIQVHTPELAADFLINRWLLLQSLGCRVWGRSAFYQSGGAFGFRDQMQDVMALVYAHPALAREHILLAASRQFREGDVQHWWHPPGGVGIRTRISDDLLWLPFVIAHYVRITGDTGILRETVAFLDAPVLKDDQHESLQSPAASTERGSLFDHCQRALSHSQKFGVHGLPLMGTGDWNDGMNLVGAGGKGESVWLAWFLVDVLKGMTEMSGLMGRPDLSTAYDHERTALIQRVEQFAWDGEWYLRATFDDGTLLGSSANAEAKIDSLPQSWALLSGAARNDRGAKALQSAWEHLVRPDDGLVLLFEPPFDKMEPSPGYIRGYPPGVRENGGQYTHAAVWLAMAMARSGDGTRAASILRMINPIERARDPLTVWRYGVEPYVIAADVYNLPGRTGQGGWSWYTGSAAWMYRAWVEEILGLHVRGETMRISPVIPGWWDGFSMTYRHGETVYEIQVENPDHCERDVSWMEIDGQKVIGGVIALGRDLIKHRIVVRMGTPAHSS